MKRIITIIIVAAFLLIGCGQVNENTGTDVSGKETQSSMTDNNNDIEKMTIYNVSTNGATIQVFNSTPNDIVNSLKEYIIKNEYDATDIKFIFENGIYTNILPPDSPTFDGNFKLNYDYSGDNQNFIYYINEIYDDILIGYMAVDVSGKIVETHNLMSANEIAKINIVPDIGRNKAISLSKEYLNLDTETYISL